MEDWLKEEAHRQQLQAWLWEDWQETSGSMPGDMAQRLRVKLNISTGTPVRSSHRGKWYYRVAVAATVSVLIAATFFFGPGRRNNAVVAYTDSICNKGERPIQALLSDGSTVWLNSGARVYIARNFGQKERRVRVTGEAFFEIKQDVSHPFYTEAAGITAQVLGTTYNVEAYPAEKEVRISLLSGKVAVHSTDTACVLAPGQIAFYARNSGSMTISSFANANPAAWIAGKIVLNKIPLPEALDRLSSLYHVPIHYDHKLIQQKNIAGEFDRDTLPVVLKAVLFVHNLKFSAAKDGGYEIH